MGTKAQASSEFLLIVASALLVLGAVVILSQQQAVAIVDVNSQTQVRNAVQDLTSGAREVYAQGTGARKRVFIQLPSGYNASGSRIANRSIQIKVSATDYVASNDFDMQGTLPSTAGGHWVWVVSEGSRVRIGSALFAFDKASISIVIDRNASRTETVSVRNIFDSAINVTLTPVWGHAAVALDTAPISFSLPVGQSQAVQLDFQSGATAVGFYNGYISATAQSDSVAETQLLPLTVEVVLPPSGEQLTINPPTWTVFISPGNTTSGTFLVCTGPSTTVPSVTFTTTSGAAGSWTGNLAPLPAMSPSTCLNKIFTLSSPSNASLGLYGGAVFGSGGADIEDTIDLTVYVVSSTNDTLGPLVNGVNHTPLPVYVGTPVTVTAVGDDRTTGNSTVIGCQLQLDNDALWRSMSAGDGAYDSPVENVSLGMGSLPGGVHNVRLRCSDIAGNTGPETSYDFTVLNEILFITKDQGVAQPEQEWSDWLSSHTSAEGYSWAYDRIRRQDVVNGVVDPALYRMVIVAEDVGGGSLGTQLLPILQSYTSAGGYLVIVDKAAEHLPEDLGLSAGYSSTSRRYVYINTNSTYITSGLPAPAYTDIYPTDTKIWLQSDDSFTGTYLATSESDQKKMGLGQAGNMVIWGATKPNTFLTTGHNISRRVFDHALLSSSIGGKMG